MNWQTLENQLRFAQDSFTFGEGGVILLSCFSAAVYCVFLENHSEPSQLVSGQDGKL